MSWSSTLTGMGLRDRQKQQTREEISAVATVLFVERGFDQVTISEVAKEAGVSKMTVTNHFPRKEDLVFDLHEELVAWPARAVRERERGESALAAVKGAYLAAVAGHEPTAGFSGEAFVRMVMGSPTLRSRLREIHEQVGEALAAALAEEADALTATAVAGQLESALRVLFFEGFTHSEYGRPEAETAEALEAAAEKIFGMLEGGIGGYGLGGFAVRRK